ncbi:hypothetical protein [Paenibacillus apiarius]|uniref:Uncharacterized protein n=1 Tax=Paenibacillus apiarius TaxID=46240 RepID=A0ABT4DR10_9BACL|nr:hypothetical protein [Paenibacillus apiarius]MCY9513327.1 hypothetical protein [Paenibacillus apiarius]MCY9519701.1 hypothetical protein [Paenibacillus apiarius]MCY9553243.1 hypothetical protein [Paenibacillus apiarius]MCY9557093.1 hypothetical protein [Paenibacillus apiarius]MCY9682166.1 hypothetical protein [Paenibacillus apiarius]
MTDFEKMKLGLEKLNLQFKEKPYLMALLRDTINKYCNKINSPIEMLSEKIGGMLGDEIGIAIELLILNYRIDPEVNSLLSIIENQEYYKALCDDFQFDVFCNLSCSVSPFTLMQLSSNGDDIFRIIRADREYIDVFIGVSGMSFLLKRVLALLQDQIADLPEDEKESAINNVMHLLKEFAEENNPHGESVLQ